MDQSRRAVEAYWRTKLIDTVTADEDKVSPVYKLEEVCELLRNSPAGIVKEVLDYILKRIDHKSPVVKQKALRLVKYAVGKSGNEFRREMQRHSAVMRQLFHYKGQVDPLKGDALNKAVRETAQEAMAAVFATDDSKAVAPAEGLGKRIQGFGNTNFEPAMEEKKSFITEVVGLSGSSLIQGLSTIAGAHSSLKKDNTGSYRGPNLRRSLTMETDIHNDNGGNSQSQVSYGASKTVASGTWGSDSRTNMASEATIDDTASSNTTVKSREERLLETIVTSGGVRLQPTRDALRAFLAEASKLDAVAMSHAIDIKLQSHLWQVRMKAVCVLEAILRKKEDEHFSVMASYFSENADSVVKCTEVPQVSLREKATKVLSLLDGDHVSGAVNAVQPLGANSAVAPAVQMLDLIDAGAFDESSNQTSVENLNEQGATEFKQSGSLVDDLFGTDVLGDLTTTEGSHESDPFSDVSFHSLEGKEQNDLFSGLVIDGKSDIKVNGQSRDLLDVFGMDSEQLLHEKGKNADHINELMSGLNLNKTSQENKQPGPVGTSGGVFSGVNLLNSSQQKQLAGNGTMNANFALNSLYSQVPIQCNFPPVTFHQVFPTQPLNYGAMGALIAQQQLLLHNLGNYGTGFVHSGSSLEGNHSLALPDIFQLSSNPIKDQATVMTSSKEEETKAFDFITDHLAASRDSKKIL